MTPIERLRDGQLDEYLYECATGTPGVVTAALPHLAEEEAEIARLIAQNRWAE